MPVESTRSQNITVTCRRSPEGSATGGCGIAATERRWTLAWALSLAVSDTSLRSAIARKHFPAITQHNAEVFQVLISQVRLRTEKSIRFSAKR